MLKMRVCVFWCCEKAQQAQACMTQACMSRRCNLHLWTIASQWCGCNSQSQAISNHLFKCSSALSQTWCCTPSPRTHSSTLFQVKTLQAIYFQALHSAVSGQDPTTHSSGLKPSYVWFCQAVLSVCIRPRQRAWRGDLQPCETLEISPSSDTVDCENSSCKYELQTDIWNSIILQKANFRIYLQK